VTGVQTCALPISPSNIWVTDIKGLVYEGRVEEMDEIKARYVKKTDARTLGEVIEGADVFLGLSAGGVLKPEMVAKMAAKPVIMALANPTPEILPERVKEVRDDAIICTGRSDYPNQVNNVLCFPFIFRGALDVGATTITEEMKMAAVKAIAELARAEQSEVAARAYGEKVASFGPEYLIPNPFDPRLIVKIAPAVAKAGMDSGVATRPIKDWDAYIQCLNEFVYHSGMIMKPVFSQAKMAPKRIVFAEGEDERVLRAVQVVRDEGIAMPVLIGAPETIARRIGNFGLRIREGIDYEVVQPGQGTFFNEHFEEFWQSYYALTERKGVSPDYARREVARRATLFGALMVHLGYADGLICGTFGRHEVHREYVQSVIGTQSGLDRYYAINLLLLPGRTVFVGDTYVNYDPSAEQLADMTLLAAEEIRNFGLVPKVALLSHSTFGTADTPTSEKMRTVLAELNRRAPELEVDGEMHGDAALDESIRSKAFPNSRLVGQANLLVMPTLDAANISFNLLKVAAGDNLTIGPILLGAAKPVNILTPTATVRRIVNMTALTVIEGS
jgi:malate dehydrogenase (oxaloacetate-decarboxylating)(NADP+)